jgi:hypothetical protein
MTDPTKLMGPNHTPADTLRDARLAKALQHMPDAHMQPSAQTRSAVLQEAMRAVGGATHAQPVQPPTSQRRWWHAWLGQPGQRVPWGAAVASVAIFGFITVMWYGQEVPDAAPERSPVAVHKDAAKAEVAAEAAIEVAGKPSAKKVAEPSAQLATNAAAPSAVIPEHTLAKVAPSAAPQPAPQAVAPPAAPVASPVADAVAEAAAPVAAPVAPVAARSAPVASVAQAAPVAANAAIASDAPAAQARLERRSKAMQAEVAAVDRSQARETAAPTAAAGPGAAPSAPPPPAAAIAAAPAKARADAGPTWTLTMGDLRRSIRPEQAQKLLAHLRGLSYGPVMAASQLANKPGDGIRLEYAGQESWVITPGYVTHYLAGGGSGAGAQAGAAADAQSSAEMRAETGARDAASVQSDTPLRSAITPAQYAALRRLAMELGADPSPLLTP